ncbi:MarR family transcriptional regulator [Nocardia sp. 2]|uniref:MarR family transcriptional regulator n=1 Tax=Nocardia acididurans TaxID=2802282 RepID=A0ABS1M4F3_9NOCA|nr:MarR family transcriptional regulator [Nocardia acididurans]MBL1074018.1 MarR family transcriptional regulator [Nocardia acididurans]
MLEREIAADLRALTAVSEQLGHAFARSENLRPNDFRALLHVATAEFEDRPLTPGQLGKLMGMSSPAVTYLVERMSESGHLRRAADPGDRRRVILHHDDAGRAAAENFFLPLGRRTRAAMDGFSDAELDATHRVLGAVIEALRAHFDAVTMPANATPADPAANSAPAVPGAEM